ncbi:MAG: hypothetical protein MZV65_16760 [Chromatiales bacterium]|nr:hypothetical protein [Chromatiales bacterium]
MGGQDRLGPGGALGRDDPRLDDVGGELLSRRTRTGRLRTAATTATGLAGPTATGRMNPWRVARRSMACRWAAIGAASVLTAEPADRIEPTGRAAHLRCRTGERRTRRR